MSITTQALRFALTAAVVCAAAPTADAQPRRVVVLDFDGPRRLADIGRISVLSALGQYEVVATQRWDSARAAAAQKTHGPAQWSRAAKQAGVDAVIEGWISEEGRRKMLYIVVREASSGREFDTLEFRIDGKNGALIEMSRKLQDKLAETLDWIHPGQNELPPAIPPVNIKKIGPTYPTDDGNPRSRRPPVSADEDAAPVDDPPRKRQRRPVAEVETTEDGSAEQAGTADEPELAEVSEAPASEPVHEPKQIEIAVAAREEQELKALFPPSSEDDIRINPKRANPVPQRTRRFLIDGGVYMGSRSLLWEAEPDSVLTQFAGVSSKGLGVNAAIYPFPLKPMDGVLSGVGFTGSLYTSLASTVIFPDVDVVEEYVLNQNGWELGAHYRAPLNSLVAIDGGAFYGNQTYEIIDAAPTFEVPDTKYSYLGAGVHLDLSITERAMIGFGARYFTVLDSGDLASVDWFGPADASGLGLEGSFVIPLPASVYVRGQLSYQRISLELSGGGLLADEEAVTGGTDSTIIGNVNVGIAF